MVANDQPFTLVTVPEFRKFLIYTYSAGRGSDAVPLDLLGRMKAQNIILKRCTSNLDEMSQYFRVSLTNSLKEIVLRFLN
jgi:hypothetical protein